MTTIIDKMAYADCIIIGGGAAGLMCAATAAKRGKSVVVLDHANKVGKKILMSGGGRCNFTNYVIEPENFLSANPHFCISALSRFTQWDFIALVEKYQLKYHEKKSGQLFCDHKSSDILNILLAECDQAGVVIKTRCAIDTITKIPETKPRFQLTTSEGLLVCESLVIATGGLSIPTMGATGFGYDIAKQFGLKLKSRQASLVPFTMGGDLLACCQSLAGVSLPVDICCEQQMFQESLLFTHKGLSGPAVLQISNYWNQGESVTVNFLPTESLADLFCQWQTEAVKSSLKNLLARYLPKRFVDQWLEAYPGNNIIDKDIANFSREEIEGLCRYFHQWQFTPKGTEGYKTAEVTRGGIDTDDVSSKTFEAKRVPGLFFIGEVLDVTGWLGGYNFQWAWASGYCAAQYV